MCVVNHGYGGFGEGRDGGGMVAAHSQGVIAFREMPEHFWCAR